MTGSNAPVTTPPLEPTTSRTGGRSAKLVAVAVAVVLAGVVYVGVNGGSSGAAVASRSPGASVHVAIGGPQTPAPTTATSDDVGPVVPIIDRSKAPQYQFLGMALTVGNEEVTGPMTEISPGFFRGGYRIRLPPLAGTATLSLSATQATVSHESLVPIGRWEVPLMTTPTVTLNPDLVFTDRQLPLTPTTSDPLAARILSKGFRVTGRVDEESDEETLTIELAVLPDPTFPVASYSLTTDVQGEHVTADFFDAEPGKYTAGVIVPDSFHGRNLTFRLMVTPQIRPGLRAAEVNTIQVSIASKDNFHPSRSQIGAEPNTAAIHRGDIFGAGYSLDAQTRLASGQRLIDFTLTINPTYPEPTPTR